MTEHTTYNNVQAHYDLSDAFFALFLDPTMTYSCAYFERDDFSLEQAQLAKIDLALGKLDLHPGQALLDIGCGWGTAMRRAAEQWAVNVIGLTLSENQHRHIQRELTAWPTRAEVHLAGWEEFDRPVDRIVSIGAFEHFRRDRYPSFFRRCHDLLHNHGRMLLHTIVMPDREALAAQGIPVTHEAVQFAKFIQKKIFPGGQLVPAHVVQHHAEDAGFTVQRVHSLQPHYARTLETWAANLEANRSEAIRLAGSSMYERYHYYLAGCAHYFRTGHLDVCQFTLTRG